MVLLDHGPGMFSHIQSSFNDFPPDDERPHRGTPRSAGSLEQERGDEMMSGHRVRGVCFAAISLATVSAACVPAAEPARVPAADLLAHFPDRAHAVVWRNWHAVEPERIANVLGTSVENVQSVASSMGLPPSIAIPPEQKARGYFYMTMCRRNWHLLPLDQLATLLETTPDELLHFLQVEELAMRPQRVCISRALPIRHDSSWPATLRRTPPVRIRNGARQCMPCCNRRSRSPVRCTPLPGRIPASVSRVPASTSTCRWTWLKKCSAAN